MGKEIQDSYLTISELSQGLYKEKGSKFLAFAYPVDSEEEVKKYLQELRKEYYDARHHCYAYILGLNPEYTRANDDGEPNHSAGTPILGQIRSRELRNVLVVVLRYFGGTKLGVSGLIHAYKTAAAEALDQAEIKEGILSTLLALSFAYPQMNAVMQLIKNYNLEILEQEMHLDCKMIIRVRNRLLPQIVEKVEKIENLRHEVKSI